MKPTPQQREALDQILRSAQASISTMAVQAIHDLGVRESYIREVGKGIADIRRRFDMGEFASVEAAASEASAFRNTALELMRARTSPLGLAIAKNLKEEGLTLNTLIAKYTIKLFGQGAEFPRLTVEQQNQVYATILERSAVSNPTVNLMLRRIAPAARGVLVVSLAYTIYEIAVAEDKGKVAVREGASWGASIAGGAAGGAVAGLMCGPGSPLCVTVGAFVGGALAAFGVQFAFGW